MGVRDAESPSTPAKHAENEQVLIASTAAAASNAWTRTPVIQVPDHRFVTLYWAWTPGAAGTNGKGSFRIVGSATQNQPAAGDDDWYPFTELDVVSNAAVAGAVPTGADYTMTPNQSHRTARPLIVDSEVASATTDAYRLQLTVATNGNRWLAVEYAEQGDATHPGAHRFRYNRHL